MRLFDNSIWFNSGFKGCITIQDIVEKVYLMECRDNKLFYQDFIIYNNPPPWLSYDIECYTYERRAYLRTQFIKRIKKSFNINLYTGYYDLNKVQDTKCISDLIKNLQKIE